MPQGLFDISMRVKNKKSNAQREAEVLSQASKQRAAEEQTATPAIFNQSLLNEDYSSLHQEGSAPIAPVSVADMKQFSYHFNHVIVVFLQQAQV